MQIKRVKTEDIIPYENNPRINDMAVESVAESIKQCGYCAPIVVDEEMLVLAGHTRLKAIKSLGWEHCEVCVVPGLTEEQKRKYRILDNKTGEIAEWDKELLSIELEELDFEDFNFELDIDTAASSYDFSEFDAECERLAGEEEISINISIPAKFEAQVREYLCNGEKDTAIGRGWGVLKRCGLH